MDFSVLLSTLKSCNFFSTEPIFKKSDVVSRWESNSFISVVLVGQSKIRVLPHDHLWTINFIIFKIRVSALTPIVGCYPKRRPLSHYPTSKIRFIKIHNNTRAFQNTKNHQNPSNSAQDTCIWSYQVNFQKSSRKPRNSTLKKNVLI